MAGGAAEAGGAGGGCATLRSFFGKPRPASPAAAPADLAVPAAAPEAPAAPAAPAAPEAPAAPAGQEAPAPPAAQVVPAPASNPEVPETVEEAPAAVECVPVAVEEVPAATEAAARGALLEDGQPEEEGTGRAQIGEGATPPPRRPQRTLRTSTQAQAAGAHARPGPLGAAVGAKEKDALEAAFADNPYPSKEDKDALSYQLGIPYKDVQHFFTKKRRTHAFLAPRGAWPTPSTAEGGADPGAGAHSLAELRKEVARQLEAEASTAAEITLPRAQFLEGVSSSDTEAFVAAWVEGADEPLAALVARMVGALAVTGAGGGVGNLSSPEAVRDAILMYAQRKPYAPGAEDVMPAELLESERAEWGLHWEVYNLKSLQPSARPLAQLWRKKHRTQARNLHDLQKAAARLESGDIQGRIQAERLLAKCKSAKEQNEAAERLATERAAALEARRGEKESRNAELQAIKAVRANERAAAAAKMVEEREAAKDIARKQREAAKEIARQQREAAQNAARQQREEAKEAAKQQREAAKEAAKRQREAEKDAVKQQREAAAEAKRLEKASKMEVRETERKRKEEEKAARKAEEEKKVMKQKQMASMFFQKMGVKKAPVQQQPSHSNSARPTKSDRKFLPGERGPQSTDLTAQMESQLASSRKPHADLLQALLCRASAAKQEQMRASLPGQPPPFARRLPASSRQQAGPSSPASKCPPQQASQDPQMGEMVCFRRKLLQFHENEKDQGGSGRPAYYGSWRRRSTAVRPRRPFSKDSDLDYDIDSADEWEEPEDGEDLLSECEDQKEEDEGEEQSGWTDGFMVEDGYLSEGEGARVAEYDLVDEGLDEGESPPAEEDGVHSPADLVRKRAHRDMCQLLNRAQKLGQPLVVCSTRLRMDDTQERVVVGDSCLLKALTMEVHLSKKVCVPVRPRPQKRSAEAEARDEEKLAKKRKIMSEEQEAALDQAFEENPWPSVEERSELAERTGLALNVVHEFFRKKRRTQAFLNSDRCKENAAKQEAAKQEAAAAKEAAKLEAAAAKEAAAAAKKEAAAAKKEAAAAKKEAATAKKEEAAARKLAEKRKLMSEEQERLLEEAFWKNPWPSVPERTALSQQLGVVYNIVHEYFRKKRRTQAFLNREISQQRDGEGLRLRSPNTAAPHAPRPHAQP